MDRIQGHGRTGFPSNRGGKGLHFLISDFQAIRVFVATADRLSGMTRNPTDTTKGAEASEIFFENQISLTVVHQDVVDFANAYKTEVHTIQSP